MKRSTAIRHLREMAEVASDLLQFHDNDIGWPLEEIWATGALLDDGAELEFGGVVLMLDIPAEELPCLVIHPTGEWIGERLRLGKQPMHWSYRPMAWPPWNHQNRRLVRIWTAETGSDEVATKSLQTGRPGAILEPTDAELLEQLEVELVASRAQLRQIIDQYWDHDWRRAHRGEAREDHLWRAASAVSEISDTLDQLRN